MRFDIYLESKILDVDCINLNCIMSEKKYYFF